MIERATLVAERTSAIGTHKLLLNDEGFFIWTQLVTGHSIAIYVDRDTAKEVMLELLKIA